MRRVIYFMGHTSDGCAFPRHSQAEWENVLISCCYRCFYCAQPLDLSDPASWTKDHLTPLIRRGCLCVGNLVCSCRRCNSMKKDKTVAEFLNMKPGLVETSGKFYTRITFSKPLIDPEHDPFLNAVRRLAVKKAFPSTPNYPEPGEALVGMGEPRVTFLRALEAVKLLTRMRG